MPTTTKRATNGSASETQMPILTKCTGCGNIVFPDANSCRVCGSAVIHQSDSGIGHVGRIPATPEDIRAQLERHRFLIVAECESCGYGGPMRSVSAKHPWYLSGWIVLLLVATVIGIGVLVLLMAFGHVPSASYDSKCPVCGARIPQLAIGSERPLPELQSCVEHNMSTIGTAV